MPDRDDDAFMEWLEWFFESQAEDRQPRRPRLWWLKRITVCWWKHRTRKLGPGVYHSSDCRACHRGKP